MEAHISIQIEVVHVPCSLLMDKSIIHNSLMRSKFFVINGEHCFA